MKRTAQLSFLLIILLLALFPVGTVVFAQDAQPIVHAILFYSNTCSHCEEVITQDLPPLIEKYGDQLEIVGLEVNDLNAQALFFAAIEYYHDQIPPEIAGSVPMLVVGEYALIGSFDIPEQLPGIIEAGLANGGIEFPDIPGLTEVIGDAASATEGHAEESSLPPKLTVAERFALDPAGNTVSVIVLLGMLVVVGVVALNFNRPVQRKQDIPVWLIPALVTLGMLVAIYLSLVEMTQTEAVCGPVGDCNTVQQSPYATLFGFLPVGVLGVIGYFLIFLAWIAQKLGKPEWRPTATKAIWFFSGFGTLFSIYLTFLEPFVIGATCIWCITSAVVQTAIFWLSTEPAKAYLGKSKSSKRSKRRHRKKGTSTKRRRR